MIELENIAIADTMALVTLEHDMYETRCWRKLGPLLKRFTGLENILTINDVG